MNRTVNVESHNVLIASSAFNLRLIASKLIVMRFFSHVFVLVFTCSCCVLYTCAFIVIVYLAFTSAVKQRIKLLLTIVLTLSR